MKTPITMERIRHHLNYSLWKYALLAVVALFGWNLIYSMTAPQAPDEKKIILGMYAYADDAAMNAYMEEIRLTQMPDMEEMAANIITPDEMYGDMILSTRIAARDCDIYLLPRQQFQAYAAQGAFMPLEQVLPELVADLEAAGASLSRGYRANDELGGEKHQYGLPCASLPGLQSLLMVDTSDLYLAVFFETGNDENVVKFFDLFVRDMMAEPVTLPAE